MAKSDLIRQLLATGKDSRTIAGIVGCRTAYVRTVKQRLNGTYCDKWKLANPEKIKATMRRCHHARYHNDPEYRERCITKAKLERWKLKARATGHACQ